MQIFRNISKKLLVAALTLGTLSTFSLDAMEREDADGKGKGVVIWNDDELFTENLLIAVKEIDTITQSNYYFQDLLCTISKICETNGVNFSIKVLVLWLQKSGKSIFEIKDDFAPTLLWQATHGLKNDLVNVLLHAALEHGGKNKVWDWIGSGYSNRSPLDLVFVAGYILHKDTFKVYLNFVKKTFGVSKIWELLLAKGKSGSSVWRDKTKNEIKPILAELQIEIPEEYK